MDEIILCETELKDIKCAKWKLPRTGIVKLDVYTLMHY